ncbi:uncharacterized protein M421DRAFT_91307 [Didymella exigua CBS 183.55]|uniref:D-lactate dehydrogenase (cytochrome) n=1 Tax=Didymella exigua CBS 183.55 TaxID=1150837 RepID=A0A6A5RS06_9PLEO|nr:uncharacterized protein M421DRAFT_91307 [Didymella exigua CBS 183.55]KAF1930130.1 hypothetical protein M421DRAFT_91307 [Didymella exigua CBS 183.55]
MFGDRRGSVDGTRPPMSPSPTMHRHTSSDAGDMMSRRSSIAPSFSSDRPSVASSVTFQMPTTVRPPPAYIAASVASQIVTDNHNAQLRHNDSEHEELENAIFSEQSLSLLNGFLDHLLFAFLSTARSPSLIAIRPAICEVLKPRLAREAAEAADEELQGLLFGEDDEEFSPTDGGRAIDRWDVEKVWKRTRLRIMVYTRLGEMEDEDEEKYVQQERGLSMDDDEDEEAGLVSWASAIFLTSVVEYVAEQTLLVAGQAAYARMASRSKRSHNGDETDEGALERLVIEEPDVEKIALNSALGRLWRTWRKRVRSSLQPLSPNRSIRPNSSYASLHRRGSRSSQATADDPYRVEPTPVSDRVPTETDIAANIPLPITERDIDEIEVPGLARTYEDAESSGMQTPVSRPQRPSSVITLAPAEEFRRRQKKERPTSMPGPAALPFAVPPRTQVDDKEDQIETPFETAMTSNYNRTSYIGDENRVEPLLLAHKGDGDAHDDMLASAVGAAPQSERSLAKSHGSEKSDVEPDTPMSATSANSDTYDIEPKVLQSKRMSIGRSGPPGIVRTFSTRSSSLKSPRETPTATPRASTHDEARSYLDDHSDDDELEGSQAIGVAKTSDVPIRSSPTPSERAKVVPAQGMQPAPRSVPSRNTPTPDSKPTVPERSGARNDVRKRASPSIGSGTGPVAGTSSPPRRRDASRDATPPTSGRTSLPSLQEVEHYRPQPAVASEQTVQRDSSTYSNRSRTQSPHVAMAERQDFRRSTDESLRSASAAGGSIKERPVIKRVGSTSSKKSGSISRIPIARDSDDRLNRSQGGRMSEEDRERQFEELVQGKETVKYTLTPENMRALDESPVVRKAEPERLNTASVTVYPRVDADRSNAFGNNAVPAKPPSTSSKGRGPGVSGHRPSPSRKVITRPLAREPRIESESMRDFADFIRSTGPSPGQEKAPQPFLNISGNGLRSPNGSSSSIGRKTSTKQSGSRAVDGSSARPRVNMEPRSPAGLSTGNDDLIDFIRQGPPNGPEGQPRIPRSVAPFRTTVDSDQFDTMLGDHGNVESAYGSKTSTLDSQHSLQTNNSRTGLIPAPSVVQPAYSNTPQNLSGSMTSSSEPVITRTRRRIKDPYAIDLSDEEDDEDDDQLTALPPSNKPPAARQESLMDFLNESEPPSGPSVATRSNGAALPMGFPTSSGEHTVKAHKPKVAIRAPAVGDMRSNRTATSDLADFLRNSGPSEPVGTPPGARKDEEKKKSSNMKFWRKNREKTYVKVWELGTTMDPTMPYHFETSPEIIHSLLFKMSKHNIEYSTDPAIRDSKANTPHSPVPAHETPVTVFFPKTTQDIATILKECNERRIAVTSFSGGTSFGGALTSTRGGICISFEHMNSITTLHEDDLDVVVQPGLGWVELNEQLKSKGLFFPVDPAPGASIGGMIAMSCSGTNAYRYGTMKEWVISLTAVLADGTIVKTHRRPRKSAAGYDLTHLVIGSEGTLALVTEATLKLAVLPQNLHVGLVTFDTFQQGVDIIVALQRAGHQLEALELADGPQVQCINHSKLARVEMAVKPTLWLKFAGSSLQLVKDQIETVRTLCKEQKALTYEITSDKVRIDVLWDARKCIGRALVMMKKDPTDLFMHSDCAVPISNLAALVEGTQKLIQEANKANQASSSEPKQPWFCANVGHIGDGNVHSSIICPAADKPRVDEVLRRVARLALSLEGTITGEHGVGLKQRGALVDEVGLEGINVMRRMKASLDPRGILNPDKVFALEDEVGSLQISKL